MLTCENISKTFPSRAEPALDSVTIEVRDGEIVGLVGLNGAGKTTLIRLSCGAALPTSGRINIDGKDLGTEKGIACARVGWIPENPVFSYEARTFDVLVHHAGYYPQTQRLPRNRIRELLDQVGLRDYENTRARTFSQGMRKRLALARALLTEPSTLLLDEILNGLDPEGVRLVRQTIEALRKDGKAILLSSHILSELQQVADRFAFLHHGKLLSIVPRDELSKAGSTAVRVRLTNADPRVYELLERFGPTSQEGEEFVIEHPSISPEELTARLVAAGYRVRELTQDYRFLEEYFMHLVGEPG
ncbi:MAG: ABC transporter ATP-binding protein [Thermoplasmata archaeon]